jgi:hypothetical protein
MLVCYHDNFNKKNLEVHGPYINFAYQYFLSLFVSQISYLQLRLQCKMIYEKMLFIFFGCSMQNNSQ